MSIYTQGPNTRMKQATLPDEFVRSVPMMRPRKQDPLPQQMTQTTLPYKFPSMTEKKPVKLREYSQTTIDMFIENDTNESKASSD